MNISSYSDLLQAAREQPEPQRLLFVFTSAEAEPERSATQGGSTLTPVMYVDKSPDDLGSFSNLVEESRQMGKDWDIVFVASMPERADLVPNSDEAEQPLLLMAEAISKGDIGNFLAFNRDGDLVSVQQC